MHCEAGTGPGLSLRTLLRGRITRKMFTKFEVRSSSVQEYFFFLLSREGKWHDKEMDLKSNIPPLATFPTSFPTDLGGKLAEKIANGSHMIAGHLATVHKYKQVAKGPKCDHMTRRRPNVMYRENKKMTLSLEQPFRI